MWGSHYVRLFCFQETHHQSWKVSPILHLTYFCPRILAFIFSSFFAFLLHFYVCRSAERTSSYLQFNLFYRVITEVVYSFGDRLLNNKKKKEKWKKRKQSKINIYCTKIRKLKRRNIRLYLRYRKKKDLFASRFRAKNIFSTN